MILRREPSGPADPAAWPRSGTWELDELFRALRDGVLDLEAAWEAGLLATRLQADAIAETVGPELTSVYENLAQRRRFGDPLHRRAVVQALLGQLHAEVFRVEHWGTLAIDRASGVPVYRTALDVGGEPVEQRLDQVVARRFWGLGFVGDDVDLTDAVSRQAVRVGVARLARDLTDLGKVLRRPPPTVVPMIPNHQDRQFEQLMLDILVENQPRARPARLREDFCQKTDLRVRYEGLARSRGARVQVKATANPERHRERLADIQRREHLVILSPVQLAEYVDTATRQPATTSLLREELHAFWSCLPSLPVDVEGLSYTIKEVLQRALLRPTEDPRGPMGLVPPPVRRVVRAFVRDESFRATAALKRDLDSGAHQHERPDGRLHFRVAPGARSCPRPPHAAAEGG
ncbi:MAG: hypothetical protein IPM29_31790 [Planctomycetes bacterium]|nr:hypothetical protein [Planctomycetota bacterium]